MQETIITELEVHCLDGQFYEETKKDLEKQGYIWDTMLGTNWIANGNGAACFHPAAHGT